MSDEDQVKVLSENINKDVPDISSRYAVETSELNQSSREFMFSFFGISRWNWWQRSTDFRLTDAEQNLLQSYYAFEKGKSQNRGSLKNFFTAKSKESVALVDRLNKTTLAKINISYSKGFAFRKDFADMVEQFRGLIPPQVVVFDETQVNYYLGTLSLDGIVVLSDAAIHDIFGANNLGIEKRKDLQIHACTQFLNFDRLTFSEYQRLLPHERLQNTCRDILNLGADVNRVINRITAGMRQEQRAKVANIIRGARGFTRRYVAAKRKYDEFQAATTQEEIDSKADDLAKKIVDLLQSEPNHGTAHMAVLSMTSQDKIFRQMEIGSSLEGIPGQVSTLRLNKQLRGEKDLMETAIFQTRDPAKMVELANEPVFTSLSPFFYNYFWKEGLTRTFRTK